MKSSDVDILQRGRPKFEQRTCEAQNPLSNNSGNFTIGGREYDGF
jgi:hypothetical protein